MVNYYFTLTGDFSSDIEFNIKLENLKHYQGNIFCNMNIIESYIFAVLFYYY